MSEKLSANDISKKVKKVFEEYAEELRQEGLNEEEVDLKVRELVDNTKLFLGAICSLIEDAI